MTVSQHDPRDERFGYECRRCLRCCTGNAIQLNPYEVARLARNRGLTTTEFRAAATVDGQGVELARDDNGTCVFLGGEGCTVHPDRPLACRVYPLGRSFYSDRGEHFTRAVTHPQSAGVYDRPGTIGDYLKAQGAAPFIAAADAYLGWVNAALVRLRTASSDVEAAISAAPLDDDMLLDMDAAIATHGDRSPTDVEERKDLHLEILHRHLALA